MRNLARLKNGCRDILLALMFVCIVGCSSDKQASEGLGNNTELEEVSVSELHAAALVLDAHADIVIPSTSTSYLSDDGSSKVSLDKMRAGGVDAVVMSIAVGPGPRTEEGDAAARAEADEKLEAINSLVSLSNGNAVLVRSSAELVAAHEAGKSAIILGFQNARSLERDINTIDEFYQAGVRIFGLNHLGHNEFSDSSRPNFDGTTGKFEVTEEHGGLSELGASAIKRINALGALIDVSQMSKSATLQALELTTSPVVASHSNAKKVSDVSRNLSDEEIDLIGENGGVINVAAFKGYLLNISEPKFIETLKSLRREVGISEEYNYPFELYWEIEDPAERVNFIAAVSELLGPATTDNMIEHINYIVDRIGVDHVGIGNDFNHGSGIDDYIDATDAMNLTEGLIRSGFTQESIDKIWSGNFLRVLDAAARNSTK